MWPLASVPLAAILQPSSLGLQIAPLMWDSRRSICSSTRLGSPGVAMLSHDLTWIAHRTDAGCPSVIVTDTVVGTFRTSNVKPATRWLPRKNSHSPRPPRVHTSPYLADHSARRRDKVSASMSSARNRSNRMFTPALLGLVRFVSSHENARCETNSNHEAVCRIESKFHLLLIRTARYSGKYT